MPIQATSLQAYDELVNAGELGRQQQLVFDIIRHHSNGMTNAEIAEELRWSINRVTPRVFELREKGFVSEICRRSCRMTGHKAIVWGVAVRHEVQQTLW